MRWWQFAAHPGVRQAGGIWAILRQARLVGRLLRDQRVPLTAKLVIPATIAYLISPVDVLPDIFPLLGQLDDIGIVLLGLAAFVRMCPRDLVAEHEADIEGRRSRERTAPGDEPIDARYRWVGGQPGR
jgi:uncharacterized membrane protein YkvA (DUF1232 family)